MTFNPLGQKTEYKPEYDKSLLFPITRAQNRQAASINPACFDGYDLWNGYELSWLNLQGKPEVRRLRIVYSALSECIVESKSLKLYLGGFVMTRFSSENEVRKRIEKDLTEILGTRFIQVKLFSWDERIRPAKIKKRYLIDDLNTACSVYEVDAGLLECIEKKKPIEKQYVSNLLKTNCPVTGQPDWGTLFVSCRSHFVLTGESLLKYIVSYRQHNDFHETCCEKIFTDLHCILKPETLIVKCFFTRRGGLDINPCRFYGVSPDREYNRQLWRQ